MDKEERFSFWEFLNSVAGLVLLVFSLLFFPVVIFSNFETISDAFLNNTLVFIGLVLLGMGILVIWLIPKLQVRRFDKMVNFFGETEENDNQFKVDFEKDRIQLRDQTRKTLAQIIGGTFFILGLIITYNNSEVVRKGQLSERFTKAIGLLKEESTALKIGGLYSLGNICNENREMNNDVLDILESYIREKGLKRGANNNLPSIPPEEDMIVIGKIFSRRACHVESKYDLSLANFTNADLTNSNFINTNFTNAYLNNSNLSGAKFNSAIFKNAKLNEAVLWNSDFSNADLAGADLSNAKFNRTILYGADLREVNNLTKSQLFNAFVDTNTKFSTKFTKEEIKELIGNTNLNKDKL